MQLVRIGLARGTASVSQTAPSGDTAGEVSLLYSQCPAPSGKGVIGESDHQTYTYLVAHSLSR
jgi:hypothetical protein